MRELTGLHRVLLEDGSIKEVVVRDATGNEQAMAAKDYISEGIKPELDELPEVDTDQEFPVSGKG